MSEFSERLRNAWSGLSLRDERTHLVAVSILAVCTMIAAGFAWERTDKKEVGAVVDQAAEAADDFDAPVLTDDPDARPSATSRSSGTVTSQGPGEGTVTVPEDVADLAPLTNTTIKVGIAYTSDAGTTNAAAGFGGIAQVDQKRAWDAVIKNFNANAPLGRKIVPVFFPVTEQEIISKGAERLQQEACAHYTKDNKVFMVWDGPIGGEILSECLTKAKIPEIGAAFDSATMKKYPYLVAPTDATRDRMAAFEVDQLHKNGFFKKFKTNPAGYFPPKPADGKPLIGLIRYDEPEYVVAASAMKSRLKAHGLSLCADCEFEVSYSADNPQEMLDDATEVNQAIQLFKAKGVTHVMFLGTLSGARLTLFYIDGAEKQNYRAMLGFNPEDAPSTVRDFYGSSSYPQFRESMVVADNASEFDVNTSAFSTCKKIFEAAGETFDGNASNKEAQIPYYCDTGWYTRAVLLKAGRQLSVGSWLTGVTTMDPTDAAGAYVMQTKKGRQDGSGAVRTGRWFDDCNCFKPITPVTPV